MRYHLLFVGTGGTGTYVLKEFSRYLFKNEEVLSKIAGMYLVDGDVVEEKNLTRQSFAEEDIGYNKATVMAEVLNDAFGLKYEAYAKYIINQREVADIVGSVLSKDVVVIVSCVDNHGARLVLEKYFMNEKTLNCVYIDTANEYEEGECVVAIKATGKVVAPPRTHYFPNILEGDVRNVVEMSCEELNVSSPQHILTNMTSALHVLANLVQLLEKGIVTGGFSSFDVFSKHSKEYPYEESSD